MSEEKYKEPKITINKVYTKSGDQGKTSLVGGHQVNKDSLRISSFGEVDELNSFIASCIVCIKELNNSQFQDLASKLVIIQHELFNLGNMIATKSEDYHKTMPQIDQDSVKFLEEMIDAYNEDLPTLKSFVLPGGSELNVRFHIARTVCRRSERLVVKLNNSEKINVFILSYLNRLSDLLFVLSRWSNYIFNNEETTWDPNYKK